MVLLMARQGGSTPREVDKRTLKSKLNLEGGYQTRDHSGQMVSWYSGREAEPCERWPKALK
jgi:hypothetical protein